MAAPISIFNTRSATDPQQNQSVGVAVNGAVTIYSEPWTGEDSSGFSITVFASGTPNGTFTRWMTDKPLPSYADDTDWVQDTAFVPVNPIGAATKFNDNNTSARAHKKRLKYVNNAGTGVITGFVNFTKTH